jgi:hypothetical protein
VCSTAGAHRWNNEVVYSCDCWQQSVVDAEDQRALLGFLPALIAGGSLRYSNGGRKPTVYLGGTIPLASSRLDSRPRAMSNSISENMRRTLGISVMAGYASRSRVNNRSSA